jgi:hypothetical protein
MCVFLVDAVRFKDRRIQVSHQHKRTPGRRHTAGAITGLGSTLARLPHSPRRQRKRVCILIVNAF